MSTATQQLAEYAAIETAMAVLREQQERIARDLKQHVVEITGAPVESHGYRAYMKPGRKSTDHRKAACDAAGLGQMSGDELQDIIDEYTIQPDPRTSWAKVTKAAGIDTSGYVTQKPPSFVIEQV